jgi:hypothetical protein
LNVMMALDIFEVYFGSFGGWVGGFQISDGLPATRANFFRILSRVKFRNSIPTAIGFQIIALNSWSSRIIRMRGIRGYIQKFPYWVDDEITTTSTCWEATQRVMATKLTRLTYKITIQLHLVAESCIICSSRSRGPVRKLLGSPS